MIAKLTPSRNTHEGCQGRGAKRAKVFVVEYEVSLGMPINNRTGPVKIPSDHFFVIAILLKTFVELQS